MRFNTMESDALNRRNFYVEKHNLVLICRFVIKAVIDKASVGDIEEDGPEAINLLATVEHILNHHAKAGISLFGANPGTFWNFIKDSTSGLPGNCIEKVCRISSLKNNIAKGRAWLRFALMEKRLAEYLRHAHSRSDLLRKYYHDGAIVCSEEMQLLIADIIGLEAIDFNFCLKNKNNSLEGRILVDYSPYLKFEHCVEGIENDLQEKQDLSSTSTPTHSAHTDPQMHSMTNQKTSLAVIADSNLKERLASLQRAFRTTSEQKGYLEQMLKKTQLQIASHQEENRKLSAERVNLEVNHEKEMEQLQSVILELQNDLMKVKSNNKEMQAVIGRLTRAQSKVTTGSSNMTQDTVSVHSDNTSTDELHLRDDSTSMRPLFGSLVSDTGNLAVSYSTGNRRPTELPPNLSSRQINVSLSPSIPSLSQSANSVDKVDQAATAELKISLSGNHSITN